jgi:hypothetical protein
VVSNFGGDGFGLMAREDNYSDYSSVGNVWYSYSYTDPPFLPPGPWPTGVGNIIGTMTNAQFVSWLRFSVTSPCRGAGSSAYASGTDLDGQPWANPPSMGCYEIVISNLVGPLSVSVAPTWFNSTNLFVNGYASFVGTITGRAASVAWSFGDGTSTSDVGSAVLHRWSAPGDYTVTFTAYNYDNTNGVSAQLVVHVVPLIAPQMNSLMLLTKGFQFELATQPRANYTVQYCTNLITPVIWQSLQSVFSSTGGIQQVVVPALTNGTRFYRLRVSSF